MDLIKKNIKRGNAPTGLPEEISLCFFNKRSTSGGGGGGKNLNCYINLESKFTTVQIKVFYYAI
jgi:hypothetical protein